MRKTITGAVCLALACSPAFPAQRDHVRSLIRAEAVAKGVPVALALAVGHVESRYRCDAIGGAGERGPMQILPATARGLGWRGSMSSLGADCRSAVRLSMRYLAKAWQRAKGRTHVQRMCHAAMRYNGGVALKRFAKVHWRYCDLVLAAIMRESGARPLAQSFALRLPEGR